MDLVRFQLKKSKLEEQRTQKSGFSAEDIFFLLKASLLLLSLSPPHCPVFFKPITLSHSSCSGSTGQAEPPPRHSMQHCNHRYAWKGHCPTVLGATTRCTLTSTYQTSQNSLICCIEVSDSIITKFQGRELALGIRPGASTNQN